MILFWGLAISYVYFRWLDVRDVHTENKITQGTLEIFKKRRLAHLTAALTDFFKSQCFFMVAINIAALVNKSNGGLAPVSLQQLYDNYTLLRDFAIIGYLPIITTLLALHMVGIGSSYLLNLAFCTLVVSVATVAVAGNFSPSQNDLRSIQEQNNRGAPECGAFDLGVYCLRYQNDGSKDSYIWGVMAYCIIVLLYLYAFHHNLFWEPSTKRNPPFILEASGDQSHRHLRAWVEQVLSIHTLTFVLAILCFTAGLNAYGAPFSHVSGISEIRNSKKRLIVSLIFLVYTGLITIGRFCFTTRFERKGILWFRVVVDLSCSIVWFVDFTKTVDPLAFFTWYVELRVQSFQLEECSLC